MSVPAAPGTVLRVAGFPASVPGVSAHVPAAARWLMPNLCAAIFAVTLFQALWLGGGHYLYRDSDTGWHILAGETILATGKIPSSDPYSFTRAGREWVASEW